MHARATVAIGFGLENMSIHISPEYLYISLSTAILGDCTPNSSRKTIKRARGALIPPLPVNMAALQDIPDVLAQTIEGG